MTPPLETPADGQASAAAPIGAEAFHAALLAAGRFEIQRCDDCARHVYFPRQLCPHCGSLRLQWVVPSGWGTVYSTSTVRVDAKAPYEVSLVDLDEGVRLMSTVRNRAPGTLRIGERVRAAVEPAGERDGGRARVVFDAEGNA